jgi:hypothetical protein
MSEESNQSIREKLSEEIGAVSWNALSVHAKGGTLITVKENQDLMDVAIAIAQDDTDKVARWLEEGLVYKPDEKEIEALEKEDGTPFKFLLVQPFVIAQRILSEP